MLFFLRVFGLFFGFSFVNIIIMSNVVYCLLGIFIGIFVGYMVRSKVFGFRNCFNFSKYY